MRVKGASYDCMENQLEDADPFLDRCISTHRASNRLLDLATTRRCNDDPNGPYRSRRASRKRTVLCTSGVLRHCTGTRHGSRQEPQLLIPRSAETSAVADFHTPRDLT